LANIAGTYKVSDLVEHVWPEEMFRQGLVCRIASSMTNVIMGFGYQGYTAVKVNNYQTRNLPFKFDFP